MATNNSSTKAPSALTSKLTQVEAGVQKDVPAKSPITIGGKVFTQPQIVSMIQGWLGTIQAAVDARTALEKAVTGRKSVEPAIHQFLRELRAALVALFGEGSPVLRDFGFNPRKPRVATSEQKLIAAAKAKITRQKRGTKSAKQKQALKAVGVPTVQVGAGGTSIVPSAADTAAPGGDPTGASGAVTTAGSPEPASGSSTTGK